MLNDPTHPVFAFLASMAYMIMADGNVDERELVSMYNLLQDSTEGDPGEAAAQVMRYCLQTPLPEFIQHTAASLTQAQKLHILANLLDVIYADGVAETPEMDMFNQFFYGFGVDEEAVAQLIHAAHIKSDRSVLYVDG